VEIISRQKKNRDYTVGFQEEAEMDRKVGFLVNLVKMIRKEQNLAEEQMLLRELNKDVGRLVQHVKLTREEKVIREVEAGDSQDELERYTKNAL